MNPFFLAPPQLSAQWKKIRTELANLPEIDQLQSVVDFWSKAPQSTMAYDPEELHTYPTPWEMINANDWCRNSIAVGMEFTLRLGGWSANRLQIQMIRDYDISDQKLVLVVDGKYFLNYEYGSVVDIPLQNNRDILATWHFNGKHYERV
jgi:hypothetical protein